VLDLSPFTHTPKLPGSSWSIVPLLVLVAVAGVVVVAGLIGVRRRDLACG
jgi:ABC-2 type transport system permease protein